MIDEQIQERSTKIENNRYESDLTLGRTAFRMAVINPMVDSYAVNSYGKVNHAMSKFKYALNTGSYNNFSIGGGNIFGEFFGKKIMKSKNNLQRTAKSVGKTTMNFVTKNGLDAALGVADDVGENIVRTGVGFSRNEAGLFSKLAGVRHKEATSEVKRTATKRTSGVKDGLKRVAKKIKEPEIAKSLTEMIDSGASKDEILGAIRKQASGSFEELKSLQRSAQRAGIKVGQTTSTTAGAMNKGVESLIKGIDDKFFNATAMEKMFGSKAAMWLTGAGNLSGKTGMAVTMGLAVASGVSVTHQESAVQSGVVQTNFNLIKGEESTSVKANEATQSNSARSRQNDDELNYIIKSSNNAESFRRDAGTIEVDRMKSSMKNFTLY